MSMNTKHDSGPLSPATNNARNRFSLTLPQMLALMGPAFVAGAWRFGPGALTSAVQAGSQYGYMLLWVILVSAVLMFVFNDMAVRLGLASGDSVVQVTKQKLGRPIGVMAGFGVFSITLMFAVGNAVGSGLALSLLLGGSVVGWTLASTVAVGLLIAMRNTYKAMERLLVALIGLMSVGFLASTILSDPDWAAAAQGLIPKFPAEASVLLIALIGTNFSINSAFYTGYAIHERKLNRQQYRAITLMDTLPGNVATAFMAMLIIIVASAVLHSTGTVATTFPQLASVLEPLAGKVGAVLFSLGFFAAAFSSMAANASAGGTLLADALGWNSSLSGWRVKLLVYGVLAWGATVAVVAKGSPIELIIIAQALTVLVAPFLGIILFLLTRREDVMGDLKNGPLQTTLALVGLVTIFAMSSQLVFRLLG
ncbi:Nramp family divalent metal transporter [Vreelandella titanicae]|jgi:Mn2+/Fe2+ NRAMP family transporter|uniref:Natural resistance-associated macrophage protein n=1 Tax=Vreelandella titanicae BH1 TaxID=1204738 RepID=L9UBI4_9GAMM|nr:MULTISPECIES: Nramp family divalent metal transporter [Halomonas]ELY21568.1 Natural resistance-associated macrophage protein [Halomonas titanicae BH1]CEP37218.1 Natural resistance-associated macrophage protein [Halomonas sp. R57-5]